MLEFLLSDSLSPLRERERVRGVASHQ